MRQPLMSGHCNFPATHVDGEPAGNLSHERCAMLGAGNKANPTKEFAPCPCRCHLGTDEYVCENCNRPLREAPMWPNAFAEGDEDADPDEMVYVHIEPATGRAIGEEC